MWRISTEKQYDSWMQILWGYLVLNPSKGLIYCMLKFSCFGWIPNLSQFFFDVICNHETSNCWASWIENAEGGRLEAAGKETISLTGTYDSNHLYHQSEYPKDRRNTTRFSFCQSKISWICKKHFIIWQTQLKHELHCVFGASSTGSLIFVRHKSIEIINHSSLKSLWLLR